MRRAATAVHVARDRPLWEFEDAGSPGEHLGVALSGGGIRAAAFGLGALQAMHDDWLPRTRYLSAVSGGSYVAAGYVAGAHYSEEAAFEYPFPGLWSQGSPEQTYLAKNLGYLARGASGRFWLFVNVMYGVVMNLLPILCGSFVAGRLLGVLLYRETHDGLARGHVDGGQIANYFAFAGLPLVLSVVWVGVRRLRLGRTPTGRAARAGRSRGATLLGALAGVLLLLLTVVPLGAMTLNQTLDELGALDEDHTGLDWVVSRFASGIVVVAAGLVLAVIALLCLRRPMLKPVAVVLSTVAGLTILLTPCLLAVGSSAVRGWSPRRDLVGLGLATAVLLLFGFVIHNRRYSMHHFYRERLSEAFFVARKGSPPADPAAMWKTTTDMIPYNERVRLSECRRRATGPLACPELLIGAAVNATDRTVSFGSGAEPFVFSPTKCGSHTVGWSRTEVLDAQRTDDGADLTLPAMVAISGAALSPVMGRFTVSTFRLLLALLNVRLGVWIPGPKHEADPSQPSRVKRFVTAVASRFPCRVREFLSKARAGWLEPGAFYVLREGLGLTSLRSRFVYVTDGGHWENLGLYELIRRRCSCVVAFDASNNPKDGLADLTRCCQLVFSRLGVEIELDPDCWAALADDGDHGRPVATGTIKYPDGKVGQLIYCRCRLWPGAPPELHHLAALDGRFPTHGTSNQFLTIDQFEAYRRLGWCIGRLAGAELGGTWSADPGTDPDHRAQSPNGPRRRRLATVS